MKLYQLIAVILISGILGSQNRQNEVVITGQIFKKNSKRPSQLKELEKELL
jgi:hypothetical protein